ncbi:MAG: sodium-translocating pyrophosphatase [bacterium]|nr:sodium-translocating pyrophosphatase [bacterium]
MSLTSFSIISAVIGLIFAVILAWKIRKADSGPAEVQKIAGYIREGAKAFLVKEYKILVLFVLAIVVLMVVTPVGWKTAVAFFAGALFSAIAGNLGMRIATSANAKTAWAVKDSLYKGLMMAFSSGSIMGLTVVGLGLLGVSVLYLVFGDPSIIYGFGFGASAIALFARVGGGIYTKAADVGADLVGKVEKGIPEDDPRNPAVIADNVGDNVGDVAGMGADLFESYVDSIVAAMVLGTLATGLFGDLVALPLLISGVGIIASILGNFIVFSSKSGSPHAAFNRGILGAAVITIVASFFLLTEVAGGLNVFWSILAGLVGGLIIGFVTEYYTSSNYKPTQRISESSQAGAGTNIISGLALGMKSTVIPVLVVCAAILIAYKFAGLYGVAMAAVGMLSTLGITLATDTYGPVADNAAGIAEMAHLGQEVRERAEELDAVGNTTAAIGKGFAIGSAALTALVLVISYTQLVGLTTVDLINPTVIVGIFIGGLLPFMFSSFLMTAVGKAAFGIVNEVRRQWRDIKGLAEGQAEPEYAKCVEISTQAAIKEMILPGVIAIVVPVLIGFGIGKEALAGFLVGSIVVGFMLAVMMANSGGAWDNAKKYIEAGNFGGKGSDSHKAAVTGDTVGDPFKDTAGPSLNILVKLMSIIALIIAPLL